MPRALDRCRDDWRELIEVEYRQAEDACNGVLLNRAHEMEFRSKFGINGYSIRRILFMSSAAISGKYASEELLRFWGRYPHVTFERFAWDAGFRHKFLRQARARRGMTTSRFAA